MPMIADAVKKSSLETLDAHCSSFFDTKFKFSHTKFKSVESVAIIDAIKDRPDFRIVPMSGTKFTDEILIKVCDLIKGTRAHVLDLSNCHLDRKQSVSLIDSMKGSCITSLDFRSNYINRKVMRAMCDLLENCNIKRIELLSLSSATINAMLSSIKKSALIKFKMGLWEDEGARIKIKEILNVQRNILNRSYTTKSARL